MMRTKMMTNMNRRKHPQKIMCTPNNKQQEQVIQVTQQQQDHDKLKVLLETLEEIWSNAQASFKTVQRGE